MGGSGFAPAFAVALGSNTLSRRASTVLYAGCVMVGALLLGNMVAKTLSSGIVAEATLTPPRALIAETIDVIAVLSGRGVDRRLAELAHVEGLTPDGDYLISLSGDRS